jgi:histidine triad (HIT) family protein
MECIFCKIVEGSVPSKKVWENDKVVAFQDIQPQAPVHILIIPKKHVASMNDVTQEDADWLADIHLAAREIAEQFGVNESGYRLINNCGPDAGQVVFHLHFHLLGGEKLGPLNR